MSDRLADENPSVHVLGICEVELLPRSVAAGASLTLKARVACTMGCDLIGRKVSLSDGSGEPLCELELTEFDGEFYESAPLQLKAPTRPGEFEWTARFLPTGADDSHEQTEVPVPFSVKSHPTRLTVWDVPPAVVAGSDLEFKVGIKCAEGCPATGRRFVVLAGGGTQVYAGEVGSQLWAGTDGLHFAEVRVEAPGREGDHSWRVECLSDDREFPHEAAAQAVKIKVVGSPECLVRVEVIDKEKKEPVKGASVVMHPFRVFTDDSGVAELRVPRGRYKLFVSGFQYFPFQSSVEVNEDLTATAELEWEHLVEHYDTIY